jgi:hypothetical protein
MKKIILSLVFVLGMITMGNAKNDVIINDVIALKVFENKIEISEATNVFKAIGVSEVTEFTETPNIESVSLRCWAFKVWVKKQLRKVSNDHRLIKKTANTLKELCELARAFDLI